MTDAARLHETHVSVVIELGDRVYKLKKPVNLDFIDFRTREVRRAVCEREVELNRRLAPDVYLGVVDVHGPDGVVCDLVAVARARSLVGEYLDGRGELFDLRARDGHVCDGRGDLQCDDIFLLGDGPRVLDCIEFDDVLRYVDVANDVAFLATDIQRLGAPGLASRVVSRYVELRARIPRAHCSTTTSRTARRFVRKIAGIRHRQGDADAAAAARALSSLMVEHL